MRHIFNKIHLWLSFPLGIVISIICISGAALVFQDEMQEWSNPKKYFISEKKGEILPIPELVTIVNSKLENNAVNSVQITSDPERNYIMGLKEGSRASIYVNPYTGDIMGKSERGEGFFSVVQRLHRWLLGGKGSIGQSVVGYTTLFFVIILITGIIIWWPKNRKQLKGRLQIKTKYGLKRFILDLHTSGGIYLVIGLLILSLTGLYYSFDWYRKGLTSLLGIEMTEYRGQRSSEEKSRQYNYQKEESSNKLENNPKRKGGNPNYRKNPDSNNRESTQNEAQIISTENTNKQKSAPNNIFNSWQKIFDELKAKNTNYKSITIQHSSASVSQNFMFGNARASDLYNFDNETGEITKIQLYKDQDGATKLRGWIYSLHTGKWGGFFSKIITFIIALLGGMLPLTGYYIFYKKRKRNKIISN